MLSDLCAPDAVLWTNTAQRELKAREVAKLLSMMVKCMPSGKYANRRVTSFEGGVHRHRLTGTNRDDARAAAECCASDGSVTPN